MRRGVRIGLIALALASSASAWAGPGDDVFAAAAIDDVRDVRRLVERGVDPHALDPRGDPLLVVAVRNDATHVVDFLLAAKGVDIEATNAANENALMIAAWRGRKEVVDRLLEHGAEVNRVGWTPLHYAASVGAGDIVAVLLDHAAYIDAESPNRTTPLMMAARGNFDGVCRQLIDAGADPTPINDRALTAADFAKRVGNVPLSEWLADLGVAWRAKYGKAEGADRGGGRAAAPVR